MDPGKGIIEQLTQDHRRLGRLLQNIDNGRWWSADEPGHLDMEALRGATAQIRASTAQIELLVGGIGTRHSRKQVSALPAPAALASAEP
ncbi:hypothetical protein [Methylobacterium frigidaeris]|uniref:Uncharacterized protein n=1 Tax=Methylobacterium frigidaeris TaxID=2038277 RepID=A0AA37HI60_9HYPH|nr:hypothetical protein [Methylobacterium frigidaeris]GJD66316.1 hypothetical protein MPEAHAMD_6513 [Methylobacterium frigidaeris]